MAAGNTYQESLAYPSPVEMMARQREERDFEIRSLALRTAAGHGLDYKTTLIIANEYESFLRGVTSYKGTQWGTQ